MSLPNTPLLTAPCEMQDLVGKTMDSSALITKLQAINPRLCVPDDSTFYAFPGMTSIWSGPPWAPGSSKLVAFHLGPIPEFTVIGPDGKMARRGWRSIFDKLIKGRAVTRTKIERAFGVSLDYSGDDLLCRYCAREGKRVRHNGGASKYCDLHDDVHQGVRRAKHMQPEYTNRATWRKTKETICL